MDTPSHTRCPYHSAHPDNAPVDPPSCTDRPPHEGRAPTEPPREAQAALETGVPAPALHAWGTWPPGPPAPWNGWPMLRRMSRDLLGALDEWQRDYGDLVHLRIWPEHEIVVTDPQLVRELLVTHHDALTRWERGVQVFSRVHGHSVLTAEGAPWKSKRHALQPPFAPKAVHAFVPNITHATAQALARWPAGGTASNIESALTSLTMDVIMRMMFTTEIDADARRAEHAVHVVSVEGDKEMYWPASWPLWMPWKRKQRAARRTLVDLIAHQVSARLRTDPAQWPDDLLARLLHLHQADAHAWPLHAVRDECMTAFLAGHETTAATLTWWAWCMAANPRAQQAARHEVLARLDARAPTADDLPSLPYVAQTLQETLRLHPAAPVLMGRRAHRPVTLGGWEFPARTLFLVPVQRLHHDPRWFPAPDQFQPERFGPGAPPIPRGAFMPFGAGPRVCLGQHLALTEMTAIAAMILQRFELAPVPDAPPPRPAMNVTLRPAAPLHLCLLPRQG